MSGYGKGSLCGDCLHHLNNHTHGKCCLCNKTCDPDMMATVHRKNEVMIVNKMRIELPEKKPVKKFQHDLQ